MAIVSDTHGNLPALEAVLADLDTVRPGMVVLGGDLALGGPHPVEVVDRIRELGWPSVLGNTDAVLDESNMPEQARGFVAEPAPHPGDAGCRTGRLADALASRVAR